MDRNMEFGRSASPTVTGSALSILAIVDNVGPQRFLYRVSYAASRSPTWMWGPGDRFHGVELPRFISSPFPRATSKSNQEQDLEDRSRNPRAPIPKFRTQYFDREKVCGGQWSGHTEKFSECRSMARSYRNETFGGCYLFSGFRHLPLRDCELNGLLEIEPEASHYDCGVTLTSADWLVVTTLVLIVGVLE